MSVSDQVGEVRRSIAEFANEEPYTDEVIEGWLAAGQTVYGIAGRVWRDKAAGYAHLVTISEAGSSRSMSDLYKNALAMAKSFEDRDAADTTPTPEPEASPYTTPIIRA